MSNSACGSTRRARLDRRQPGKGRVEGRARIPFFRQAARGFARTLGSPRRWAPRGWRADLSAVATCAGKQSASGKTARRRKSWKLCRICLREPEPTSETNASPPTTGVMPLEMRSSYARTFKQALAGRYAFVRAAVAEARARGHFPQWPPSRVGVARSAFGSLRV